MTEAPVRGIATTAVSDWLEQHIDGAKGPFDFALITGGHSNLTYSVAGAEGERLVLRRPPLGLVMATAHNMAREHRIVDAVASTTVPVPRARGLCEDETVNEAPFYIMSFVDGVVLHDAETTVETMPDSAARRELSDDVVNVLANLHLTNPDDIGLGDLGRKEAYLDRQLKRFKRQWETSKTRELPTMDRAFDQLVAAKPEQRYTGIVHGDYRLGNMLVDTGRSTVSAVLDWELCTLGDVLADLGYLLNNWAQPGEDIPTGATSYPTVAGGFTTREQLVDAYAARTGFDVDGVDYYRAFQKWRLAAIVEGVLHRYLEGVMGDDETDTDAYKHQVEALADQALQLLDGLE